MYFASINTSVVVCHSKISVLKAVSDGVWSLSYEGTWSRLKIWSRRLDYFSVEGIELAGSETLAFDAKVPERTSSK